MALAPINIDDDFDRSDTAYRPFFSGVAKTLLQ